MSWDDYRLLTQIGAGRDGVAYRAEGRDGTPSLEVRVLPSARNDPERWQAIVKRLNVLARFDSKASRRILELDLGHDPPFVVMPIDDCPSLDESISLREGLNAVEALDLALAVTEVLAAAHRLGLAHGHVDPMAIRGERPSSLALDFTGVETASHERFAPRPGFRAPEVIDGFSPTPEADVYSLAALIAWLMTAVDEKNNRSPATDDSLLELLQTMLAVDPDGRPTTGHVRRELAAIVAKLGGESIHVQDVTSDFSSGSSLGTIDAIPRPVRVPLPPLRLAGASESMGSSVLEKSSSALERLGRFRLLEKLGEGGMGEVYKAEDEADGSLAAVKVLRGELARKDSALRRFRKEARLLGQVKNPYVTKLLEVNEDAGVHYIVLEYVDGHSLAQDLEKSGKLDESTALAIAADVARGLMDAHRLGIVHRDIKPANILLVGKLSERAEVKSRRSGSGAGSKKTLMAFPRVKLSDFGLARHAEQGETHAITQAGVIVGTPTYMSPEQCEGRSIDARSDVYSLGVTLFEVVSGKPPFQAGDWRGLIAKHLNEPPPSLKTLCPDLSQGFCHVVEKALAKSPAARYADASAILDDLERLLRGEPTGLPMHPILPDDDARKVLRFDFVWQLEASPRQLWPHVSNTDRLDRAIGFGAVNYTLEFDPARGVRRFLAGRKAGMPEEGEEHPYEWIEGRRLGVFREYAKGPFYWVVSIVELTPRAGGGTTLTHRLRLVPRGRLIRLGASWGVGNGLRKELEKVYRRIDSAVMGKLGALATVDPFEAPPDLDQARRVRLDERLALLTKRGIEPAVVEALERFLALSPAPELARVRPIALARRLGLPEEAVVAACMHGANVGLFVLLWDLLCPVCRIPSEIKQTLRDLASHGHCEACHMDYELDFSNSVELIFQVHPEIREADLNTYCAAGPAHSRHVVAQVRVHQGERFELDLDLAPGAYRLAGPQLGWLLDFQVRSGAVANRWDFSLAEGPPEGLSPILGPGGQVLTFTNDSDRELLVRVERTALRDDALTAARASSMAVFRQLFPTEVLAPGRLVSISNVTLLVTGLDQPASLYEVLGDVRAFGVLHEQFRRIDEVVTREGGAVVKTIGEGVLAAFGDADSAFRAGLAIPIALAAGEATCDLRPKLAAHRGPAMAATLNEHLDYFGTTVHQLMQSLACSRAGRFVLTQSVASDPDVAARISRLGYAGLVLEPGALQGVGPLLSLAFDTGETVSRVIETKPLFAFSTGRT